MTSTNRWLTQLSLQHKYGIILFAFLLTGICFSEAADDVPGIMESNDQYVILRSASGETLQLALNEDDDGDGIDNGLEINGFTYNDTTGLNPWNGDSSITYYKTDPKRWSTDGDPYSDLMEVSGVNMPAGVPVPENHPLVAARPVIKVGMTSYKVTPKKTITTSNGGEQSNSYSNQTSETDEVGGEVSVGFSLNPLELGSADVTASYSHSWTTTKTSENSFGTNWNTATTEDPSEAASLTLNIYMENLGSATALDVRPTFNLVLGNKTLATITLSEDDRALQLAPAGLPQSRYPATGTIAIERDNDQNEIILTLDELRAIQFGAPLGLVVTQVSANVQGWDAENQEWKDEISWTNFEAEIDPVIVNLKANLGDNQYFNYQVYVGTSFYDMGLTFRDVMGFVFNIDQIGDDTFIEDRKYPDAWYISTSSSNVTEEWIAQGSNPEGLLNTKMFPNTKMILMSPGETPKARIDMAVFGWDGRHVYVSAFPGNFPILSVKARVTINGREQKVELVRNDDALFSNEVPFALDDLDGHVIVENARGDIAEVRIAKPAVYKSAQDVKLNSSFLPYPGAEYLIALEGDSSKIVKLYCQFYDQATKDTLSIANEYLTLPIHAYEANYVDWWIDGQNPGRIYYDKIRIGAEEAEIIGWDLEWTHGDVPADWAYDIILNSVSFGSVRINGDFADSAFANIDLSGTKLSIHPETEFEYGLYGPDYSSIFIDDYRQVVNVKAKKPNEDTYNATGYVGLDPYRFNLVSNRDAIIERTTFASSQNAIQFDPEGYVNMGENGPDLAAQTTMEAWINPTSYLSSETEDAYILGKEKRFSLVVSPDGTIQLGLAIDEITWKTFNMHYQAKVGEWVHVAYTFDYDPVEGWSIMAYINGNLFHQFKLSGISELLGDGNPGSFTVGSRVATYDDYHQASIDELRFWNVIRTQEQIRSTMNDTLGLEIYGTDQNGLTGYWRFDELEELGVDGDPDQEEYGNDDVRDLSVNGNHGDLSEYGAGLGASSITSIDVENTDIASTVKSYTLRQNYPNPFNPSTTIEFSIEQAAQVQLVVYNVAGQEMTTLINEPLSPGSYKVYLNAEAWPSGLYFYKLTADRQYLVKRMLLIK